MNPTILLHLNAMSLRLSDTLTATLSIDGTAPLAVTLPKPLLSEASASAWKITPRSPATVTKLIDGQERWTQVYDLDPYTVGDTVPVTILPITVSAGTATYTLTAPSQSVAVKIIISEGNTELRPLAGPEPLPVAATPAESPVGIIFGSVAFAIILLAALRSRWRRPRPIPTPAEIAMNRLANTDINSASFCDDLAAIIRRFMNDDAGKPWPTMTTDEIARSEADPPLLAVLQQCDGERFAGEPLNRETRFTMWVAVQQFLTARLPNQGQNLTSS